MPSLVVCALSVLAATATPGRHEVERFQNAFLKGEALYQKQSYAEALKLFVEADKILPTPETAYNLARCHEKLSNPGMTSYYYRAYLKRAPKASDARDVEAQLNFALAKAATSGQGYLEIEAPGSLSIAIGSQNYSRTIVALFIAAGAYEVEVQFPRKTERTRVTVQAGQETTQTFISTVPKVSFHSAPSSNLNLKSTGDTTWNGAKPVLHQTSYYVLGTAAAIIATGAIIGSMSNADGNRGQRRGDMDVQQAQALIDSANSKGRTATSMFVVGGAVGIAGAGLLVFTLPEPGLKETAR